MVTLEVKALQVLLTQAIEALGNGDTDTAEARVDLVKTWIQDWRQGLKN